MAASTDVAPRNQAHVLAARLALIDRVRAVEHRLARGAQRDATLALLRHHLHALGNSIQIVDLASAELARRTPDDPIGLIADLRSGATAAYANIKQLIELVLPVPRTTAAAPFASAVRAAVDSVRPALMVEIDLHDELLASTTPSLLEADEVETLVIAVLLDAHDAHHLELVLRERRIEGAPWFELIRVDDRPSAPSLESELAPPSLLAVVDGLARLGAGELALGHGRTGHELVIALPAA